MKFTKMALAASLIAGASFANASDIKYGLQIGYANGGDNINGDLDAGNGIQVGIYSIVPLSIQGLSIKVAANYIKKDDSFKDNSNDYDNEFTRMPIDLLLIKQLEKFQLAAGITYHINSTYKFTDNIDPEENGTTDADNALGLLLEANYQVYRNDSLAVDLGLRYTNIEYKFKDEDSTKFNGSNVAFVAGLSF